MPRANRKRHRFPQDDPLAWTIGLLWLIFITAIYLIQNRSHF